MAPTEGNEDAAGDGNAAAAAEGDAPRSMEEHEAAREGDPVAGSDFREGDQDAYVAGLREEKAGYERRMKQPEVSKETQAMLKERISAVDAEIKRCS